MAQSAIQHPIVSVKHVPYKTLRGRCLVAGDASVGKTALVKVLFNPGDYPRNYVQTCTADISTRVVKVPNAASPTQVDVLLVDWPGATHFNTRLDFAAKQWESSDVFVLVYDIGNRDSFVSVAKWHRRALDALAAAGHGKPRVLGALVANKSDFRGSSRAVVSEAEGKALAAQLGLAYFETSAEAGLGVEAPFAHIAREIARLQD